MALPRNDSSSVISSLQMDYGDSDEEESDVKQSSFSGPISFPKEPSETEEIRLSPASQIIDQPVLLKDEKYDNSTDDNKNPVDLLQSQSTTEEPMEVSSPLKVKEEDEDKSRSPSPAVDISDDEHDDHHDRHSSHKSHRDPHHEKDEGKEEEKPLNLKSEIFTESLNTDSPASQGSVASNKPIRKAPTLVSYGHDDDVGSDEDVSDQDNDGDNNSNGDSPALNSADASILSRSVQNMDKDEIKIPPEPPGKCPYPLQRQIEIEYTKMKKGGVDHNRLMQERKSFRNPSIYDKLIDYCHIDQNGTNFPPEIYNPHVWGKESFYDELDKAQRKDMEKREKEKKERTKIDFMTGVKKSSQAEGQAAPDEKKRKTKWDAQPSNIQVQFSKPPSAAQNPGVVNLTTTATGTKGKVISAVGTLSKKPSK